MRENITKLLFIGNCYNALYMLKQYSVHPLLTDVRLSRRGVYDDTDTGVIVLMFSTFFTVRNARRCRSLVDGGSFKRAQSRCER